MNLPRNRVGSAHGDRPLLVGERAGNDRRRAAVLVAVEVALVGLLAFDDTWSLFARLGLGFCALGAVYLLLLMIVPWQRVEADPRGLVVWLGTRGRAQPVHFAWTEIRTVRLETMPTVRAMGPIGGQPGFLYISFRVRAWRPVIGRAPSAYLRCGLATLMLLGQHTLANVPDIWASAPLDELLQRIRSWQVA